MKRPSEKRQPSIKRRDLLLAAAGGLSASLLSTPARLFGAAPDAKTGLGIVIYCCGLRQKALRADGRENPLADPLDFLEHCRRLGAGGIQTPLGARDEAYAVELRRRAETCGMFIEAVAALPHDQAGPNNQGSPRDQGSMERFEREVLTAKQAGAKSIRVVMIPGRRYENYDSAEQFRQAAERGLEALRLAEPIAARHRVRLAVENHKDHRAEEKLDVLKKIDSEYVGMCVDTGNSIALLEDPLETARAFAPWAFAVHLKDAGVREYEDGFLLGDVPLGEGVLDLPQIVRILRESKPDLPFSLELITRDPLQVPCLTEEYWATFADVPGRDLARTLRTIRRGASPEPLPRVSGLSLEAQVEREEENIRKSLVYARDRLKL